MSWEKFAISGATYARALRGAAARSGAALPEVVLRAIEARPEARLVPGLGTRARGGIAGALRPTPYQQELQLLATKIPDTGEGAPGHPGEGALYARYVFGKLFGNRAQIIMNPDIPPYDKWLIDHTATRVGGPMTRAVRPQRMPIGTPPENIQPTSISSPRARRKMGQILPALAQIGVPLVVTGTVLASKPGIRADIENLLGGQGSLQQKDLSAEIPQNVQAQAVRVAEALRQRGLDPAALRFAVDAPTGAGKTTLSRALANQMHLRHRSLDWRPNLRMKQLLGGADVESMPIKPSPGEILEHHQLLRTYDPESFDVAIHILRDPATLRRQLIQRGRGARAADLMDLDKSIDVGRRAFDSLGGELVDLGDGVMMRVRPQNGWDNNLDSQLAQMGIDPQGLSRHEKLLSLSTGHRTRGAGWTPYLKSPLTPEDEESIRSSISIGEAAARALSQ